MAGPGEMVRERYPRLSASDDQEVERLGFVRSAFGGGGRACHSSPQDTPPAGENCPIPAATRTYDPEGDVLRMPCVKLRPLLLAGLAVALQARAETLTLPAAASIVGGSPFFSDVRAFNTSYDEVWTCWRPTGASSRALRGRRPQFSFPCCPGVPGFQRHGRRSSGAELGRRHRVRVRRRCPAARRHQPPLLDRSRAHGRHVHSGAATARPRMPEASDVDPERRLSARGSGPTPASSIPALSRQRDVPDLRRRGRPARIGCQPDRARATRAPRSTGSSRRPAPGSSTPITPSSPSRRRARSSPTPPSSTTRRATPSSWSGPRTVRGSPTPTGPRAPP